jgi:hypothetical protein
MTCSRSCSTAGRSRSYGCRSRPRSTSRSGSRRRLFTAAIERLGQRGIAFGNDPGDAANGRADDPPGGAGRACFRDRDGHFYELVVAPAPTEPRP